MITASIVTYHNNIEELKKAIESFLNSKLDIKLYISDNSSDRRIEGICSDSRVKYIYNNGNLGFGKGHNIAVKEAMKDGSKYHLILNPDIYFEKGVIESLAKYMDTNEDVGLVMPKVLYPDGSIQYLCKLLPTPINLIGRKFLPFKSIVNKMDYKYEMRFTDYNTEIEVPYLSGCFMFIRTSVFNEVGMFDDNIFMYLEDTDLSRRINEKYKTIYYPKVTVYHKFEKGSFKNKKLLKYHIKSAIYYFNKWGWIFDRDRKTINDKILKEWGIK
jgi:hypothetical protein